MATGVQLPAPAPSAAWGLPFGRRAKPRRGDELPDADWVVRHGLPMRSAYAQARPQAARLCTGALIWGEKQILSAC